MISSHASVQVSHLCKAFGGRPVLQDINLIVQPKEVLAIVGPSGCGKTTLLNVISGLEPPTSGTVELADDNITLVFQYSALFDSLTIFENVAFSLVEKPDMPTAHRTLKQYSPEALQQIVREKLNLVGLHDVEHLYPNEISGGMQKRVSLARAIVSDPQIILYDEPTAGLDPIASTVIEDYILALRDEIGATSIVVTHQLSTIKRTADRVCLLFDGHIQWLGTLSEFFTTTDPYARQFLEGRLDGPMAARLQPQMRPELGHENTEHLVRNLASAAGALCNEL